MGDRPPAPRRVTSSGMGALTALLRRLTSAVLLRLLLFAAIFSLAAVPPLDPDLWWHLANGRLLLATHAWPQVDAYSFSAVGHAWVMHEWLADAGMYLLDQAGGLPLLVVTFGLVVTAGAVCLYLLLRSTGLHPTAAVALTLTGAMAGSTAWGARPQLLNLLLTGVLVLGLVAYRAGRLRAWMLPPLIWLWANLHSGFLVGVIIAALFAGGEMFDSWRGRPGMPRSRLLALGWAILAALALAVVNPYGLATLLFPLGTLTSPLIQNNIQEWASPDFHSMAGVLFEGLLFVLLLGLATGKVRARSYEWLWAFALLYLALSSQRHVPLFVIGAAPLAGRCAQAIMAAAAALLPAVPRGPVREAAALRWSPPRSAANPVALGAINLALLLVVGVGMIAYRALPNLQPSLETAAIARALPVASTDALAALKRPLRVFNYYDYGGYLVWRLQPGGSRVFIDGRVEVYGADLFTQYLAVNYVVPGWRQVLQRYQPDAVVLPSGHPLVAVLDREAGWTVLARDPVATAFIRVGSNP